MQQHEPPHEIEIDDQVPEEVPADGEMTADSDEDGGGTANSAQEEKPGELTAEEQAAEWKERAMRAAADLDNFRKRMAREKTEALRYANQALLEDLLPILDNFEMGLQAAASEKDSMIFRGLEMVKKQLDEFLSRQGVQEVPAEGQPFDPNVHEAVAQEPREDAEEGSVLRVIRRGYRMHDRLVRPANVVVAGAPEPAQEADDN